MSETKTGRRAGRLAKIRIPLAAAALLTAAAGGWWTYQRFVTMNFHAVVAGRIYRSAQPAPEDLRRWTKQYGLKTVINLRGNDDRPPVIAEVAAARELHLAYYSLRLPNHVHPDPVRIRRLIEMLTSAEEPILFHCKSGADRAGVAAVIAAMAVGGEDYPSASKQMSFRYLHFDGRRKHVAGFLTRYEDYRRQLGGGMGGWNEFRDWLANVYSRRPYTAARPEARPLPAWDGPAARRSGASPATRPADAVEARVPTETGP